MQIQCGSFGISALWVIWNQTPSASRDYEKVKVSKEKTDLLQQERREGVAVTGALMGVGHSGT